MSPPPAETITWTQVGVMISLVTLIPTLIAVLTPIFLSKKKDDGESKVLEALLVIIKSQEAYSKKISDETHDIKGTVERTHRKTGEFKSKNEASFIDLNSGMVNLSHKLENLSGKGIENHETLKGLLKNGQDLHKHIRESKEEIIKAVG